ncbi:hypothetical protein MAPG_04515 [Magnaporthiopsis poae ATCC 64411]|uniref:Uncharacterized protein n=1 Tax=Magnaporthiopsis poae (strain ATCC 64411 / 73-15) TaxID=644358 RepID=A0A0C4DWY1_MAGP6|nr:hypothetical protein MAPG_04515 [Magnaporthiopsis poae ATCC 64411]
MSHLELISNVIPAFVALARDYCNLLESEEHDQDLTRREHEGDLAFDANICYQDLALIAQTIAFSLGEWRQGLDDKAIINLMKALESRLPKLPAQSLSLWLGKFHDTLKAGSPKPEPNETSVDGHLSAQFPRLTALASKLSAEGLGGYGECERLVGLSSEDIQLYRSFLSRKIRLFRESEERSQNERNKFLHRIKDARAFLVDVYCRCPSRLADEAGSHISPSSSFIRTAAETAYCLLGRNWKCSCSQRVRQAGLSLSREVRLGLSHNSQAQAESALFEVIFPLCQDDQEWKPAKVEVRTSSPRYKSGMEAECVAHDICLRLKESGKGQVHFVAGGDQLWQRSPKGSDSSQILYQHMKTLDHLLGDGTASPDIARYYPKERLLLCYALCKTCMDFYQGAWLRRLWRSDHIYLRQMAGHIFRWDLEMPFLPADLTELEPNSTPKATFYHYHKYPIILGLGIVLLEIATSTRFPTSQNPDQRKRYNEDFDKAKDLFEELKFSKRRGGAKLLMSGLIDAIRACLEIEPPSDSPTNQLAEDEQVRQYVWTRIVRPLEETLANVWQPKAIKPQAHQKEVSGRRMVTIQTTHMVQPPPPTKVGPSPSSNVTPGQNETVVSDEGERRRVDEQKVKLAETWFKYHGNALNYIKELGNGSAAENKRIKIAILDSGLKLSEDHQIRYNYTPEMKYCSWVDEPGSTEPKDGVGHGTHLAVLLRKIAQEAEVHVARVYRKRPGEKSIPLITKAIEHAADVWQVDIVVMAFGFDREFQTLKDAIRSRTDRVLFFAAASNDGKNRTDQIAWPARHPDVICVHSADGHGNPSTFSPDHKDNMRIMTLGEGIRSAWPPGLLANSNADKKGEVAMSGTSCATAVAVGIAALILGHAREFATEDEWKTLHTPDCMRRILGHKTWSKDVSGYLWVMHWNLFEEKWSREWIRDSIRSCFR